MAAFTGSVWSILFHSAIFGIWILINTSAAPVVAPWGSSPVVLAMIASVEANPDHIRPHQPPGAGTAGGTRSELTLQVSLLAEHEVTKLAGIVIAIARELKVSIPAESEVGKLAKIVSPDAMLNDIARKRPEEKRTS